MHRFLWLFFLLPCTVHAFWPLSWEFNNEKRFFGPLASYEKLDENIYLTVRPLLFAYDSEDGGRYHFLYPLGKSTKEKSYFIPFFLSKEFEGRRDTSIFLFFFGESQKGAYGGFFPFYGRLYNRFSKDEMGFFAWPLYSYTENEGARKTNILWPFFSFYSGEERGVKAWPIYGTREREGVKRTSFFLWPIFHKEKKDLDTDEPVDIFYAFPFYMQRISEKRASYTVIWPLFSYARDVDKRKWDILWPIFSRTEGEERKGFGIFPLFSYDLKGRDRTVNILWPLYKESEWYSGEERFFQRRVLLLSKYEEEKDKTFLNVWPLFDYRDKDSEYAFFFPSIFPFREQGFDRIIKPLFTLWEQRGSETSKKTNLLYGLFTSERNGDTWKMRFAFLLEVKKDEEGFGFQILAGLFGIDKKKVKIFYIPFERTEDTQKKE